MKTVKTRNIVIGEGIPKICVPIIGKNQNELLQEIDALAQIDVDIVEWRMDHFEAVSSMETVLTTLHELRLALQDKVLLVTFRSEKEGGEKTISNDYYKKLNMSIIGTKEVDLIDVELYIGNDIVNEIINYAHQQDVFVVMSNHDFDATPAYEEIINRLTRMQKLQADILKIAVMPKNTGDLLELLRATNDMYTKYATQPLITMSMAGTGALSRMCGEVFGSSVTFGSVKQASAPGQMAVNDLKQVLEIIHKSI